MTNDRPRSAGTQAERILKILVDAHGKWVPLYEISTQAAQYSARIHELRAAGFDIQNRAETMIDGARHTWFCLPVPPPKPSAPASLGPLPTTMPLFGKEVL